MPVMNKARSWWLRTLSPLAPLYIIPIPFAAAIDNIKRDNLIKRGRKCAVSYDQGRVVSTSQTNGFVLTK